MSLALVREPGQDYDAPGHKHDTGYKYLLSRKATFVQFLRTFIAADWVKDVDVEDVTLIPRSFILQDFRHQEADMVYKLRLAGQDVYFYLLLELQSTVDSLMPFRLLMYMVVTGRRGQASAVARPDLHSSRSTPWILTTSSSTSTGMTRSSCWPWAI